MPFGLMNVGATFQRAMDYAFRDILKKVLEIYEDDLIVYSKRRNDRFKHLRQLFEHCCKYGISLNPKIYILGVIEDKLLGHVVTKEGVKIDPERLKAIKEIPLLENLKALRSFFGKINCIHKFIPNFTEITQPLNKLLKKDANFRWTEEAKKAFEYVKEAIT